MLIRGGIYKQCNTKLSRGYVYFSTFLQNCLVIQRMSLKTSSSQVLTIVATFSVGLAGEKCQRRLLISSLPADNITLRPQDGHSYICLCGEYGSLMNTLTIMSTIIIKMVTCILLFCVYETSDRFHKFHFLTMFTRVRPSLLGHDAPVITVCCCYAKITEVCVHYFIRQPAVVNIGSFAVLR